MRRKNEKKMSKIDFGNKVQMAIKMFNKNDLEELHKILSEYRTGISPTLQYSDRVSIMLYYLKKELEK